MIPFPLSKCINQVEIVPSLKREDRNQARCTAIWLCWLRFYNGPPPPSLVTLTTKPGPIWAGKGDDSASSLRLVGELRSSKVSHVPNHPDRVIVYHVIWELYSSVQNFRTRTARGHLPNVNYTRCRFSPPPIPPVELATFRFSFYFYLLHFSLPSP